MDILKFIPVGHRNAVTRKQLCIRTGLSDRKVRELIEKACTHEHPILNMQDGQGYFQPAENEISLVRLYRNQENSRTSSTRRRVKELDQYIKDETNELKKNQISIFDVMGGG